MFVTLKDTAAIITVAVLNVLSHHSFFAAAVVGVDSLLVLSNKLMSAEAIPRNYCRQQSNLVEVVSVAGSFVFTFPPQHSFKFSV